MHGAGAHGPRPRLPTAVGPVEGLAARSHRSSGGEHVVVRTATGRGSIDVWSGEELKNQRTKRSIWPVRVSMRVSCRQAYAPRPAGTAGGARSLSSDVAYLR